MPAWTARLRPAAAPLLLAVLLLRIILTYPVFNDVVDEQGHILAGLEFLETGKYEFEAQHPPLGRLAVAALPYSLAGFRYGGRRSLWMGGPWSVANEAYYWRTLWLARAGNLIA